MRDYLLKSDCGISQELLIKEPTEENIQTGKQGNIESVRMAEVKGHSGTYSQQLLLPAESERRQQQNHEDQEGVAFMHRRSVFSRPADTQRRSN